MYTSYYFVILGPAGIRALLVEECAAEANRQIDFTFTVFSRFPVADVILVQVGGSVAFCFGWRG